MFALRVFPEDEEREGRGSGRLFGEADADGGLGIGPLGKGKVQTNERLRVSEH